MPVVIDAAIFQQLAALRESRVCSVLDTECCITWLDMRGYADAAAFIRCQREEYLRGIVRGFAIESADDD